MSSDYFMILFYEPGKAYYELRRFKISKLTVYRAETKRC